MDTNTQGGAPRRAEAFLSTLASLFLLLILGVTAGNVAHAQEADLSVLAEAAAEREPGWSGAVTGNYYERRGNSRNEDWGLGVAAAYQTDGPWRYEGQLNGQSKSENNNTTDESYNANLAAKYYLNTKSYGVGRVRYAKDRFSGIEEEALGSAGYGRELFQRGDHRIIGEAGAGVLWTKDSTGQTDTGPAAYAAGFYTWQLTEHSSFSQLLGARYSDGDGNWRLRSISEIKATIIGSLAGKFTYEIKRNSEVPSDDANSDFYTTLGLEYTF
jgi:putative salt-induced outer membrane protein